MIPYGGNGFKDKLYKFGNNSNFNEIEQKLLKATLKPLSDKVNILVKGKGIFLYPKDISYS